MSIYRDFSAIPVLIQDSLEYIVSVWNRLSSKRPLSAEKYYDALWYTLRYVHDTEDSSYTIDDAIISLFTEFFFLRHDNGTETIGFYYKRSDNEVWKSCIRKNGAIYSPVPISALLFNYGTDATFPCVKNLYDDGHIIGRDCLKIMKDKGLIDFIDDILAGIDHNGKYDDIYIAHDYMIDDTKPFDKTNEIPDPFGVIARNEQEKLYLEIKNVVKFIAKNNHDED